MNTSINLHFLISKEIQSLSERSGVPESELVRRLVIKIRKFNYVTKVEKILIEYQQRLARLNKSGEKISAYEKVHFCPDGDMIDFTKYLRYKHRISLSKFVAASFLFFWDEIVKEVMGEENDELELLINYEKIKVKFRNLINYFRKRLNYEEVEEVKLE